MDVKRGEPRHYGTLMRGATGELWFFRDDYEAPKRVDEEIRDEEVRNNLNSLLERLEEQPIRVGLPEDINDILEDIFGPLWWCIGFLTAQRLNR
jgi:hypothetical protein